MPKFNWSYPEPLDPNKPSLIGGKLRNVIGSFTIYIRELQDAINVLRTELSQPTLDWGFYYAQVGDTLLYEHIRLINLAINTLLNLYGYNSVIDILGRNWSLFSVNIGGKDYFAYAIIQDFRDVLNALSLSMETWESAVPPIGYSIYNSRGYNQRNYLFSADLGLWDSNGIIYNGYINVESLPAFYTGNASSNIEVLDDGDKYLLHYTQTTIQGYFNSSTMYWAVQSPSASTLLVNNLNANGTKLPIGINSIFQLDLVMNNYQVSSLTNNDTGITTERYPSLDIKFYTQTALGRSGIVILRLTNDPSEVDTFSSGIIKKVFPASTGNIQFDIGTYISTYLNNSDEIYYIILNSYLRQNALVNVVDFSIGNSQQVFDCRLDNIGVIEAGN